MLISYTSDDGRYEFVKDGADASLKRNTYTVIVGKNGTGKSRLLRAVVLGLMGHRMGEEHMDRSDRTQFRVSPFALDTHFEPEQVICVSTSSFDRFPLLRRGQTVPGYSYLGLRGLSSANPSMSYLSKIANTLVDSVQRGRDHAAAIAGVLDYLGYEPSVSLLWSLIPHRLIEDMNNADAPSDVAREVMRRSPNTFSTETAIHYQRIINAANYQLRQALDLARDTPKGKRARMYELRFEERGLIFDDRTGMSLDDILLLINTGLLRLRHVELRKKGADESFLISEASSGEQAVVLSLLGIGSQIQDRSLICIDEPEICLHPEWQEKYIQLLYSTFQHFEGCHFVIATHSPQIVANLPSDDCHVMSMETGVAVDAASFSRKSIDYQLAEVFGAPGVRNEYLSRIALNLFASVSKVRRFDADALRTLQSLEKVVELLQSDDPVYDLIMALREMRKNYA